MHKYIHTCIYIHISWNEVIFLPFWRVCRMSRIYIYDSENVRSWVMKWGAQQRLGVVASRWLGSGKAKVQGRGMGWGAIAFHLHHVLFRICLCISAFCLDEKGCWRTSFLCTHVHEFLYILHLLHLFILLSYLIFDFVCLTLSLPTHIELPNTHAHTYRDTHTHAHTKTKNTKTQKRKMSRHLANTVTHLGENKRLHLQNSKQNYNIISLWVTIKEIFKSLSTSAVAQSTPANYLCHSKNSRDQHPGMDVI